MTRNITRLIIADDHQIFIDGLKSLLNDVPTFKVIGEVLNGKNHGNYI
jgi:DNA-binding NarL/FixJ family response regulator